MAGTTNPIISGTEIDFAGGTSGQTYNNSDLANWVINSGDIKWYGSDSIVSSGTTLVLRRWVDAIQPDTADYGISVRVRTGTGPTHDYEFWLRASESVQTGYRFRVNDDGTWSIVKVVNGTPDGTANWSGDFGSLASSTDHFLEAFAVGSVLRLYVNADLKAERTDSSSPITAQGYGLYGFTAQEHFRTKEIALKTYGAVALGINPLGTGETIYVGNTPTLDPTAFVYGGTPPYTYERDATGDAFPTGLSLNTDGSWAGTVTADGESKTIRIKVTDSAGTPATVTSTDYVMDTTTLSNDPPIFIGPNIADINLTVGQSATNIRIASLFSDAEDTLTFSEGQVWPAGCSIVGDDIVFDHTAPFVAGTYSSLTVLADDGTNTPVPSNTFSIIIAAAPTYTASFTTPALDNGTQAGPIADTAVSYIFYPTDPDTARTAGTEIKGTGITNGSGVLTSESNLPAQAGYALIWSASWAGYWFGPVTPA